MTITTKQRSGDDIQNTDTSIELEFFTEGKLIGTLTVFNMESGNSYIDYTNELENKEYNLLHLNQNGTIENDVPKDTDPLN